MVVYSPMQVRLASSTLVMILGVDMIDAQVRGDMEIDLTGDR
jgi:hypothetical protein